MGSRHGIIKKSYLLLSVFAVALSTICFDGVILSQLKKSYSDTENMIAGIAGSNSYDEILKWMKESPDEAWLAKGKASLAAYGYFPATRTIWDKKYLAAKHKILFASAFFDFCLLSLFYFLYRFFQKRDTKQVTELENLLRQIQTTASDKPDFSKGRLDAVLEDRILSLWEQIQTDRRNMYQEKESTKSLVTDISHQLKTPVAALKTSLELLSSEEMTKAEEAEFLGRCMHQINGLENLTKALINVSRMEKGMIQLKVSPANIRDTILSAVSRLYQKAAKQHISIEMPENSQLENASALHDKKWTAEVFVNILDNAIKYSKEDTTILITVEELTTYLKIDIQDEGIGIAKSDYPKIFQRFYRGEEVKEIEGSGVGLYLAREIIEKQNGSIFVRARTDGRGSIFSVHLPKA